MRFNTLLYSKLKRFIPVDRAEILWLNTHEFLPAKPIEGAACRPLSAEDIQRLSAIKELGIDRQFVKDFQALGFVGIGMFVNKQLAGLSIFATQDVPARYNRHGDKFNGVQVHLPPGTRCLIKAIILPEHRGQRLHSAVVRYAIDHFDKELVHTIVTSYDSDNDAFESSSLDQGFEKVGKTLEIAVLGKSAYKLSKPIDALTGKKSKDEDGCIVLHKAGFRKDAPPGLSDRVRSKLSNVLAKKAA